jgi:hypothetical protein
VLGFVSVIRLRVVVNQTRNRRRLFRLSTQTEKKKTSPSYFFFFFSSILFALREGKFTQSRQQQQVPLIFLSFFFLEKKWEE